MSAGTIQALAALGGLVLLVTPARADDHIDPNAHLHRYTLTTARHTQTVFDLEDAQRGVKVATARLRRCDSRISADQDVGCVVEVEVADGVPTFGASGDGLDVITTQAELDAVLDDTTAWVKVVTYVSHCGGVPGTYHGCARQPGSSMVVENGISAPELGETLVHELGHNKGLTHRSGPGTPFMHPTDLGNDEVNAYECAILHQGGVISGSNYPVEASLLIDDSFSMHSELNGVKEAMARQLEAYPEEGCNVFQLTTFKDSVTMRDFTTDLELVQQQVAALSASGGGDCPEASFAALNIAQYNVGEGGRLLIATDGSPRGAWSLDGAIETLRRLGRRVDVVLSGDCDFGATPGLRGGCSNDGDIPLPDRSPPPLRPERYRALPVAGDSIQLFLDGDDFQQVLLPFSFPFGGEEFSTVYVGSNGFVTFGQGSIAWYPSPEELLTGPRCIAPYWEDLSPQNAGTITVVDTGADFRVIFDDVVQWNTTNTVSFTLILRPDGTFRIDYGTVTATSGLAGCSVGTAVPDPGPIDLSAAAQPIQETAPGTGTAYEEFPSAPDLSGLSLEFAPLTASPPRIYTDLETYSLLASETGGVFTYQPEVNFGTPSEFERFVNTVFNLFQAGLDHSIALAEPPVGPQGSTFTLELTGAGTNFRPGTSVSVSGSGVSVGAVTVHSPVRLTAAVTVDPGAAPGFRDVATATDLGVLGLESATGVGVLEIVAAPLVPTILGVTPSSVPVGESATVVVSGAATGFDGSSVLSLGAGVSIGGTTALSATSLQAEVIVSEAAAVGFRDVVVTTGAETATESRTGPFFVSGRATATPTLLSISESIGAPGQSLSVSVVGRNTAFAPGASSLSFSGSGIVVLSTTVTSPTTATADILIEADAELGLRDVRMSTGTELVALLDGFNVSTTTALDRRTVEVFPARHSFRPVAVGATVEQAFRVANSEESTLDLEVQGIEMSAAGAGPFTLEGERSFRLSPGEAREVVVRYAPDAPGNVATELRIRSDDPDRPLLLVPVTATAGGLDAGGSFPNPFGPADLGRTTTIRYQVPASAAAVPVTLRIYDLSGREVRTLEDGELPPGHYSRVWDGRSRDGSRVAAGVYLYRLVVDGAASTRKVTVLR